MCWQGTGDHVTRPSQRLHRAKAKHESLRAPCAALTAPGQDGGVVRQHSHGLQPRVSAAQGRSPSCRTTLPDPHHLGAASRCRRPAPAGTVPRSSRAHQLFNTQSRSPDPCGQSAAVAWRPSSELLAQLIGHHPAAQPAGFSITNAAPLMRCTAPCSNMDIALSRPWS